jgi:hypothetical protein
MYGRYFYQLIYAEIMLAQRSKKSDFGCPFFFLILVGLYSSPPISYSFGCQLSVCLIFGYDLFKKKKNVETL